jgi:hypothetical protein
MTDNQDHRQRSSRRVGYRPICLTWARQVRAATDHAANAAGRLARKDLLKIANDEIPARAVHRIAAEHAS